MSCDANTLVQNATTLQSIDPGMQIPVAISLLQQIAGNTMTPDQLVAAAAGLQAIPDGLQMPVAISVLCQIANE